MVIYYWSPCLEKVGTYKSTINSAISLAKYSGINRKIKVINSCGEWNEKRVFLNKNNVELIDFGYNYFKFLPKSGFIGSRISYSIIFLTSLIPLLKIFFRDRPDYLIIHLLTSLPLFLNLIFKNKTKIILRISGYPKLNLVRKLFWKLSREIIYKITCPSIELKKQLIKLNLFDLNKVFFLADPVIRLKDINQKLSKVKSKKDVINKKKYFIAVGRLTRQKNFKYLIEEFRNFIKKEKKYNLLIFGEGENKIKLQNLINSYDLNKYIKLMGYTDNIFEYMREAEAFLLTSLWEDPGFVLIEAAICNLFIISSDCRNGPREILSNGKGGLLFQSNKKGELNNKLIEFLNLDKEKHEMKLLTKKKILKYTIFRHYKSFEKILI